jgi:hypothetical protein
VFTPVETSIPISSSTEDSIPTSTGLDPVPIHKVATEEGGGNLKIVQQELLRDAHFIAALVSSLTSCVPA